MPSGISGLEGFTLGGNSEDYVKKPVIDAGNLFNLPNTSDDDDDDEDDKDENDRGSRRR
jgi:hypothetical protein